MNLSANLEVTKNRLNRFFPLRTKDERKDPDWNSVLGMVIGEFYQKELALNDLPAYQSLCEVEFKKRLDDPSFWPVIKTMYFDSRSILEVAPEFLLFRAGETEENKHNQRIGDMFVHLMGGQVMVGFNPMRLNFIEKILFDVLNTQSLKVKASKNSHKATEVPFLPFLTNSFKQDLAFLGTKPSYLLDCFESFLRLYGFLYASQLAHNLLKWSEGEPKPCANYMILDTEKASAERHYLKEAGYKQLYKHAHHIFPYLTMSEMLQSGHEEIVPLWQLAQGIKEVDRAKDQLNAFAQTFKIERALKHQFLSDKDSPMAALGQVLKLSMEQFRTGNKDKDDINSNFAKATLKHLCADFIQQRGAAGSVLVLNQDYLLLLTNLVIGNKESLRLNEVIRGFNQRGVFFDKQSQAEVVQFYERIGNVERMSDSGDAVYVRKTV
ncbi:DNA phosphorothioation-dependent restriction protein DptG [Saccharospirillum sp.]|uniref:DNA phosphorothioation-dependent restriction protein DptG n=1 Tax=Saccharospirillum sp. TaxID=2033801 RepID=UPI0034A0905C